MKQVLISFQSGHYKSFKGTWKGDSVWSHFILEDGTSLHFNKDKIEYMQVKDIKPGPEQPQKTDKKEE